jgi:hypothetical protein
MGSNFPTPKGFKLPAFKKRLGISMLNSATLGPAAQWVPAQPLAMKNLVGYTLLCCAMNSLNKK